MNMAEQGEKADVVIMDPPRSGSTEEFMDAVGKLGAEKCRVIRRRWPGM